MGRLLLFTKKKKKKTRKEKPQSGGCQSCPYRQSLVQLLDKSVEIIDGLPKQNHPAHHPEP